MIILYIITLMLFIPFFFLYKNCIKESSIELKTLLVYSLGITILPGILISPLIYDITPRLKNITLETSILVSIISLYFLSIFLIPIYIINKKYKNIKIELTHSDISLSKLLLLLSIFYLFIRLILYYKNTPLYFIINNDVAGAAQSRQLIQSKKLGIDIPYIGATFKIFISLTTYSFYISYLKHNKYFYYFLISFIFSILYFILDMQKAPIFIIITNLILIYYNLKKLNIKLILLIVLSLLSLITLVISTSGNNNILHIIYSIIDRIILGQIQSMYYMFQYLDPSLSGFGYDFYFSSLFNERTNDLPPNIKIIPYIPLYENNHTLVNVNTFYFGDTWSYLGWLGIFIIPPIIAFIFYLTLVFFDKIKKDTIYLCLSITFFSFYPITRSLTEILSFKYLLHYIIFGYIPLFILKNIHKHLRKKNEYGKI
uniref:Wzy n=1 Tax=Proteus genomosp. 4 TaxID=1311818 RepID=A0A385JNN2_9GAMM|nr:wzy [Proteus genomosp. 4]